MKIQIASDLHLELRSKIKFEILPEADVLVLAGDIHKKPKSLGKFFRKLLNQRKLPIIYIMGNHEYYDSVFPDAQNNYRAVCAEFPQVRMLEKDTVRIQGVHFIGTALYSDLTNPIDALSASRGITDFMYDKKTHAPVVQLSGSYGGMTPDAWTTEWRRCREFLVDALEKRNRKFPTVVVTHFAPTKSVHPERFKFSPLRAAFESELSSLMELYKPELWIYGHDHGPIFPVDCGSRMTYTLGS
jgi:predicted phosphodiesterase